MGFPVNSTSVITWPCKRLAKRVLQHSNVAHLIASGSVFSCRRIDGSSSWSQHSWGNAVDLFPTSGGDQDEKRRHIANNVVEQATKRTLANRGVRCAVHTVIDHDARRVWTRADGWHAYTGDTGDHVHVDFDPPKTGTPGCA